jgi:hypothetical protein
LPIEAYVSPVKKASSSETRWLPLEEFFNIHFYYSLDAELAGSFKSCGRGRNGLAILMTPIEAPALID